MSKYLSRQEWALLFGAALLPWLPMLFVSFLNDDFQVIGAFRAETLGEVFAQLTSQHVWGFYWRPVPAFLYALMHYIYGFYPAGYHLLNLTAYSGSVLALALLLLNVEFSKRVALLTAVLFALLPSHELAAGWLSGLPEPLSLFFLLLAAVLCADYLNNSHTAKAMLMPLLPFLLALGSKEVTYTGFLLPLLLLAALPYSREMLGKALRLTGLFVLTEAVFLLYRFTVIGSNPFNSGHIQGFNPVEWLQHLLLYVPVSFLPPSVLESLSASGTMLPQLLFLLLTAAVFLLILISRRELSAVPTRRLLFGAGWFLLFIIPVVPTFMRWYVFVASAGLTLFAALILDALIRRLGQRRQLYWIAGLIAAVMVFYSFRISLNWVEAGERTDRLVTNIILNREYVKSDTVYVWGAPDKMKGVPVMKLGLQQTFQFALERDDIKVESPLRFEAEEFNHKVMLEAANDSLFSLVAVGGRFVPLGSRTSAPAVMDSFTLEQKGYSIEVETGMSGNDVLVSRAVIRHTRAGEQPLQLYYDGEVFRNVFSEAGAEKAEELTAVSAD